MRAWIGRNAAQGAAQEVANSQAATAEDPSRQVSRVFAQRATEGALASFRGTRAAREAPEAIDVAVSQAVATAFERPAKRPGPGWPAPPARRSRLSWGRSPDGGRRRGPMGSSPISAAAAKVRWRPAWPYREDVSAAVGPAASIRS